MEPFDRQPPRFVPTLTDVVPLGLPIKKPSEEGGALPITPEALEPVLDAREHAMGNGPAEPGTTAYEGREAIPLEVQHVSPDGPVQPGYPEAFDAPLQGTVQADAAGATDLSAAPVLAVTAAELQHMLVQRILERVQPVLEAQLQEVVASVVLAHAQSMAQHLHQAVEEVVQHAVADAMEQEQLQSNLQFLDDEIPPLG